MKKLFFFAIALLWTGFSSFSKTLSLQGEFINPSHRYIQYIGRISHKTPVLFVSIIPEFKYGLHSGVHL